MLVSFFALLFALSGLVSLSSGLDVHDVMVNNGSHGANYYFNPSNMADFGVLKDVSGDKAMMKKFQELVNLPVEAGSDGETADIIKRFFWGKSNGIIMEIGAADGVYMSQSLPLETGAGWHRILVDGAPPNVKGLTNSGAAIAFACAICDSARQVHYSERGVVSGIIEFMSPVFFKRFHPTVAALEPSQWHTLPNVQKIACFPLQKLLAATNVHHINVFVVDVEGGELAILHSINWSTILFDVIVVETDTAFRSLAYEKQVTAYLFNKGYHKVYSFGRNTWYKRSDFVPSLMQ